MAKSGVKVLGSWASPYANKVQIALNLKSIDYEFIQEDVSNKSQLLLESNPFTRKSLFLSMMGSPYASPSSLFNTSTMFGLQTGLPFSLLILMNVPRPVFGPRTLVTRLYSSTRALFFCVVNGEEGEKTTIPLEEVYQVLDVLENAFIKCSKGQKFFGGDKIGYVDIEFGSCLSWINIIAKMGNFSLIGESNTPNLFKWAQDFCCADAVKVVLPETDKLMEYAKSYATNNYN
ncbi:hypothetical protein CASFOL_003852 [Castilleja foliolosa]|uniref:glutathione transferase n=1 Tax=Castilleja foliolosa TaxID=1961234 RepID=A0ABD3EIR6_9LAMI